MNEPTPSRHSAALKRLAEHLAHLNRQPGSIPAMESDMLSLLVSGALNGENLAERYPDLHQKLLQNPDLRAAFLEAIEAIEADRAGTLTPIPAPETNLPFLQRTRTAPNIKIENKDAWQVLWQRSLEQIQAVFSPPDLAYRAEQNLMEEPWFTLLRDEIQIVGITYAINLDCTLAAETENHLAAYVALAVTPDTAPARTNFPLRAKLQWGDYQQTIEIPTEGRKRFPDIPFEIIFDPTTHQPRAGLSLTLETVS